MRTSKSFHFSSSFVKLELNAVPPQQEINILFLSVTTNFSKNAVVMIDQYEYAIRVKEVLTLKPPCLEEGDHHYEDGSHDLASDKIKSRRNENDFDANNSDDVEVVYVELPSVKNLDGLIKGE
ncbi:hypothetical protein L1887_15467 [Cichorium endivia]|nr:hypothetical protein L1887_15467 [Cichorium endivia]